MRRVLTLVAMLTTGGVLAQMRGVPSPLPVKLTSPSFPADGGVPTGSNVVASMSYPCGVASVTTAYTLDSGVQTVGSLASRVFIEVCHTRENDVGLVKCTSDTTTPSMTKGTKGEVLAVGECVTYGNAGARPVYCLGNAGTALQSFECAP